MTSKQTVVFCLSLAAALASPSVAAAGDVVVREVKLVGVSADRGRAILETLATRPGAVLSEQAVAADIVRLWKSGSFDNVEVRRGRAGREVLFIVTPHPLGEVPGRAAELVIETIEIHGNRKTRDSVIRRELLVSPGGPLSRDTLVQSAKRLRRTGFFDAVDITVTRGTTPRLAVVSFAVKERATGKFSVGISAGEISGLGATANVSQSNLFGTGQSLSLSSRLSRREQNFQLLYVNPRIADSHWRGVGRTYNTRRQFTGFRRHAVGAAMSLSRPLPMETRGELTYKLERVTATPDEVLLARLAAGETSMSDDLFRSGLTSSVRVSFTHESRDRNYGGLAAGTYAEVASRHIGSDHQFQRYGAFVNVPMPIAYGVGAIVRGSIDLISSHDPRGVPLTERLRAGGIAGVRGYSIDSLGPMTVVAGASGPINISAGGNLRLLTSAELHFPLSSYLGLTGLVFADAGNVFSLEKRSCATLGCPSAAEILAGLRASAGFGFRWASPIGHLRFEWGVPITRRKGDPKLRFHFGASPRQTW